MNVTTECTNCGSGNLSWFCTARNEGPADDGRIRMHEVGTYFVLGCRDCSETLQVVSGDQVAARLNRESPEAAALDQRELEDLAHSANQEALSSGVSLDVFMRLANSVYSRAMATSMGITAAKLRQLESAERTVQALNFTYTGGRQWKPPLGKAPDFDRNDRNAALLAEIDAHMRDMWDKRLLPASCWPTNLSRRVSEAAGGPSTLDEIMRKNGL